MKNAGGSVATLHLLHLQKHALKIPLLCLFFKGQIKA